MKFKIGFLFALVLCPVAALAQVAPDAKVVFLKGTALMTANADGSNIQTLVNDGVSKSNPRWSPTGDKIVYEIGEETAAVEGVATTSITSLVVITAGGQLLQTMPQDTGGDWFFSVDEIGWYSGSAVFLTGAENRELKGYLALDITSMKAIQDLEATTGEDVGFETCPAGMQVAYPADARAYTSTPSVSVWVNGSTVYTAQLPAQVPSGGIPFLLSDLRWSGDCSRLSFIESNYASNTTTFVVLAGTSVEARVPLPTSAGWPVTVVPVGSSFAILSGPEDQYAGDTAALLYNTTTHTLDSAPSILQQLQQREASEQQLMKTLGGESPDWYRSSQ
ncbi:MAG: hypothetical protein ACRD5K_12855 [Candidatus Acidiferrales bacterium]